MSVVRAVVRLPYTTGLPEDAAMNTFHFITASPPTATDETDIMDNLEAFYQSDWGTPGDPVSEYISNIVSRAANACTIELFNLDDPEPRIAIADAAFTLGATASASRVPQEVAVCASFQAAPISGVPQARRRGRVYIGPLNLTATDQSTGRPAAAFITALKDSMQGLITLQVGQSIAWAVYSRVGNAAAAVTNGWVDDEFDTQRRRQLAVSSRTVWP